MSERLGYVVKRFPRASETFIAQEILELERRGARVHVLTLWPNDVPARHAWLDQIEAPITHCGQTPLSDAWKWLHRRAADSGDGDGPRRAVEAAFMYPDRRGRHRLREAVGVACAALELELEHLHAHFANDPAFVAYLAHLASGVPYSFTAHAKDIYAKRLPEDLLRDVVDHAAFAVTVSEDNRRHLAQRLGPKLAPKILRLYNGVDLDTIRPMRSRAQEATFRVLCVARLVAKKGVATLIEALSVLARQGLDLECTVIGDGPEREPLERRAAGIGLDGRVAFRGTLAHEDVVEALHRHDVLALPAKIAEDGDKDALPTVLLEAMAAGLPCVSTAVGGIPEIIVERETGLILASPGPLALADALSELAGRPELRRRMGEAARRRAETLFDRRANVEQLHRWMRRSARGAGIVPASGLRVVEG